MSDKLITHYAVSAEEDAIKNVLSKLEFDALPVDYLLRTLKMCKDWPECRGDDFTDEMANDVSKFPGTKNIKWNEIMVSSFERFFEHLKQTPIFTYVVYSILKMLSYKKELIDENGRVVLDSLELSDSSHDNDIMKIKSVGLQPIEGMEKTSKCAALFFDDEGGEMKTISAGSLGVTSAYLGELGTYLTQEERQTKAAQNPYSKQSSSSYSDEDSNVKDASYIIVLNGHLNPLNGPTRFAKLALLGLILDARYMYYVAMESTQHPAYTQCHSIAGFNLAKFVVWFTGKIRARCGTKAVADAGHMYQKIKLPIDGTPKNAYIKMKTKVAFNKSSDIIRSRHDLELNNPALKYVSENTKKRFLTTADTNAIYKPLNVAAFIPGLAPTPLTQSERLNIQIGDLARVSFNVMCYNSLGGSQANQFLTLYLPCGGIDITRRALFAGDISPADMSYNEFYNRRVEPDPEAFIAVVKGLHLRRQISLEEACEFCGIEWPVYERCVEQVETQQQLEQQSETQQMLVQADKMEQDQEIWEASNTQSKAEELIDDTEKPYKMKRSEDGQSQAKRQKKK